MALVFGDRVLETSTTTGTGAFTLAAAITGYQRFSAVCSTSDTIYYAIFAVDGSGNPSGDWETGLGTYSSANTLTRTTVSKSSNSNSAVSFAAGTKYVMACPIAANLDIITASIGASQGDILYRGASGWARLAAGTAGQALVTAGASANPAWGAATPSIQSVTSSATVTPTFSNDQVNITAQGAGLTLANPTGTAVPAWGIVVRIKDDGTARSIAYGTQYRALGVALPTTTVISKTLYLGMIYNSTDTKWDVVAVAQEA